MASSSPAFCSFRTLGAICVYMMVGPSLILLNKHIISSLEFRYPIMLASLGVLTSAIMVHSGHRLDIIPIRSEVKQLVTFKFFIRKIAILGFFQGMTLNCGNQVYKYLSVSLIQMLKAFTPVMTLCLMFLTQLADVEFKLIIATLLLSCGTAITCTGVSEQDNSIIGLLFSFGAEFSEAIKVVLSQKLLQGAGKVTESSRTSKDPNSDVAKGLLVADDSDSDLEEHDLEELEKREGLEKLEELEERRQRNGLGVGLKQEDTLKNEVEQSKNELEGEGGDEETTEGPIKFTVFETLYYYAPITFFFMCVLALPLEMRGFVKDYDQNMQLLAQNWYLFVMAGLLGFGVNMASFAVTGLISALYLKALSTFRNICLIVVAVVMFDETLTLQEEFGYMITMVGFSYYNYLKITQKGGKSV